MCFLQNFRIFFGMIGDSAFYKSMRDKSPHINDNYTIFKKTLISEMVRSMCINQILNEVDNSSQHSCLIIYFTALIRSIRQKEVLIYLMQ